jgi:DNA polymerase I-like protein with 3'-5' exonuclease and polymerase domains/uracil-DNA glycosylase
MGFFLEDRAVALMTAKAVRAPRQVRTENTTPGCDNCAMRSLWPRMATPKIPIFLGSPSADILVLGDGPNIQADGAGMPFYGSYWQTLRKAIPARHWERMAYQNVARCSTMDSKDHKPKPAVVHSCSVHLDADLASRPWAAIVVMGDSAMRRIAPDVSKKTTAVDMGGTWFPVVAGGRVTWAYATMGLDVLGKFGGEHGTAWPVFKADWKHFFNTLDRLDKPHVHDINLQQVVTVNSLEEATAFRERMGREITTDIEGTGLRPTRRGELMLTASFSDGVSTMAFAVDHPMAVNKWAKPFIVDTLTKADRWCAHQAGMELAWFAHMCGLPLEPDRVEDTMAMARIIHNNENLLSLADQTRIHLGVNVKELSDLDVTNLIAYPLDQVLTYNGLDSYATHLVWNKHRHITKDVNYRRLVDATTMVTQMQLWGLPVNLECSHRLKAKWSAKAAEAELKAQAVYEVKQWQMATQREWSITNDQDTADALVRFGKVLLPKSDAGNYKTDETLLKEVAGDNPLVTHLLDYREASKLCSTYIDPVIDATNTHTDGLLHPCYSITLTATGRRSSEDPNIQNFPRRFNVELRGQIVCPPGTVMVAFDYGQLEARILAMASKDRALMEAIINKYDIHAAWGPKICAIYPKFWEQMEDIVRETYNTYNPTEKQTLKVMRDRIKNGFVFPSFYGSYVNSIADRNLFIPREVVDAVQKDLWKTFPGVQIWMKARRKEYVDTGSIRTLTGRVRHAILKGNEPINCVDFETECLTQRGWLTGQQVHPGDVLLTMNPNTQKMEWQAATDIKRFPGYHGPVYHMESKGFSAVTTPNHRWPCISSRGVLHDRTTENLPNLMHIPRVAPYSAPGGEKYSNEWVELVGWVLTDGFYSTGHKINPEDAQYRKTPACGYSGSQIGICQKKPERVVEIDALFAALDISVRSKQSRVKNKEVFWHFSGNAGRWFHGMFPNRMLTMEFLLQLTPIQLSILQHTMLKGDGHIPDSGSVSFVAGSKCKQQIDMFQALCLLNGNSASVVYRNTEDRETKQYASMGNVPVSAGHWALKIHKRTRIDTAFIRKTVTTESVGMWCPMVPNTYFMARRNGQPYITGNTPIQGTASDVTADAMNECAAISRREQDPFMHPRVEIHDDLTFFLPDDDRLDGYVERIFQVLGRCRYKWQTVPWLVEAKAGYSWEHLEEFADYTGDYHG